MPLCGGKVSITRNIFPKLEIGYSESKFICFGHFSLQLSTAKLLNPPMETANSSDSEMPLLPGETAAGAVDYAGEPAVLSKYGRWRSASFIIGVEVAERIAYYGISGNLITYLTGPLGQSTAAAAANLNAWSGISSLLPLVGAAVADSFLGRYRTIVAASFLYILGLGLLTLSAMLPSLNHFKCSQTNSKAPCDMSYFQTILFFFSLYLVALGQGGHKPCVQAFGADQFDGQDPEESKAKSSFFNWWYFGICIGATLSISILSYVQDNLNWGFGFGIPCLIVAIALVIFLLGSTTYRYAVKREERSPFTRIGRVFVAAVRNSSVKCSETYVKEEADGILPCQGSEQFKFLNKALLVPDNSRGDTNICTVTDVEEAKAVLRLFPIWATSLVYGIVFSQISTFFVKQGATLDRTIGKSFTVPSASLQGVIGLAIVLCIPIYDRVFVPTARAMTGKPAGITMLQRIGIGMFICFICMVVAAMVEMKRVRVALKNWLIDKPDVTMPMSVWWLLPQYLLFGVADVFCIVGLQEFFYDQVPTELRSVGLALYLSVLGIGSLLSSALVSAINEVTGGSSGGGWFAQNLNRSHLDYFYWLLAGIDALGLALFVHFAKSYVYNHKNGPVYG